MNKISKNEYGFSAVELIIVIVTVALIGIVGWLVYKDHHKTTMAAVVTTAKTTTTRPATITKTTTTTTNPSNTVSLASGAVTFTVPDGWSGQVEPTNNCNAAVGSPVTEDNDCVADATVTLNSTAQTSLPLTVNVSAYTLKDTTATPQSWFENDMQETQANPAEGDITSHDSINGQASYYLEQNASPAYIDENYVIISKNLVVYAYVRMSSYDSNVPSSDFNYTQHTPEVKQLADSIKIN